MTLFYGQLELAPAPSKNTKNEPKPADKGLRLVVAIGIGIGKATRFGYFKIYFARLPLESR